MSQIDTKTVGVPSFLKKKIDQDDKAYAEEACALYLRAANISP